MTVRNVRRRLGLTQEGLASRLGVSCVTVNRWEAGKSKPKSRYRLQLIQLEQEQPIEWAEQRAFRPIQYLGSKLRLLDHIESAVMECSSSGRVVDLFSGSGVVANALSYRFDVTATDIQQYSCDLARALLLANGPENDALVEWLHVLQESKQLRQHQELFRPLIELEEAAMASAHGGDFDALIRFTEMGSVTRYMHDNDDSGITIELRDALSAVAANVKTAKRRGALAGQIALLYGGAYFSYRQAVIIDVANMQLRQLPSHAPERTMLLGALLSAASSVCNTVGKQFAQPMRLRKRDGSVKQLLLQRTLRDRSLCVLESISHAIAKFQSALPTVAREHEVIRADYRDFLDSYGGAPSCFYADPPYTIDHYSRFYHVLETIARGDTPQLDIVSRAGRSRLSNGLYRSDRHQSPFCIPSQVRQAFRVLLEGVQGFGAPLVLSYSPFTQESGRPRLLTLEELQQLAEESFSDVSVRYIGDHRHRKLHWNTAPLGEDASAEALIICRQPKPGRPKGDARG